MSHIQRFPIWRYATDLPVYRTVGGLATRFHGDITIFGPERTTWLTRWHPAEGVDYIDREFTLDAFELDGGDDRPFGARCPCGEYLWTDWVGDLLREIYWHCAAAGHPRPGFDE